MLKLILSLSMIFIAFIMFFLTHPLSMGLSILIQTLLMCLITGLFYNSYWYSYILFLTFLGGLLILFIYTTSISSNEIIKFSLIHSFIFLTLFIMMIFFIYLFWFNQLTWMNLSFNYEMINFFEKYIFFNNENKINLSKLYNEQTFIFMMMMIIYLFITMVAVVKITNINYGPLRSNK